MIILRRCASQQCQLSDLITVLQQLTFNEKTVDYGLDFFNNGHYNLVFAPNMICGIGNRALANTAAIPNADTDPAVGHTTHNLNVHRIFGRRPLPSELRGN